MATSQTLAHALPHCLRVPGDAFPSQLYACNCAGAPNLPGKCHTLGQSAAPGAHAAHVSKRSTTLAYYRIPRPLP